MPYKGRVENGVIVLDEPVTIREGAVVLVDIPANEVRAPGKRSFREHYAAVIGKAVGLPEDAAENLDHYLYGHPKK